MNWLSKYIYKRSSEDILRLRQGREMPPDLDHKPVIDVIYDEMRYDNSLISLFNDRDLYKYHMDFVIYPIEEDFVPSHVWVLGIKPGEENNPISRKISKLTTFGEARKIAREIAQKYTRQYSDRTWNVSENELDKLFNP